MTEEKVKLLLQKYLDGDTDQYETDQIEEWYLALDKVRNKLSSEHKKEVSEKIFLAVKQAMESKSKIKKIYPVMLYRVAAVLLIGVAVILGFWKLKDPASRSPDFISVTTTVKEHKKITLTDGSEILLGPSAKLIYPQTFNPGNRSVELISGNAFFTVVHKEKQPFIVRTSCNLDIKVLGTSFGVKTINSKPNVEITVATGKVAVSRSNHLLGILTKGQTLNYNKKTGIATSSLTRHEKYIELEFNAANLKQVIQKLEYVYDIKISMAEGVNPNLKLTAVFLSRQQPEEIIDIICSLHHLRFSTVKNLKSFKIYK
ncbi:putative anti-sigma factor [Arcticibacter svalbardensis MN12-7]|uniref:Putative anti-sigma factor n=1 Tax=Arcticibacter svalbardensis MN12-7 TaxID=1150600 RepID=R9GQ81_9SPHI|nr:FecR family protein [Arcticibacter svalbardensis]EOR93878.1 putative anti-sigma factor [Arcticibacter svalbardensis MN12-7]